ncbi:MAG: hypothetical protein LUG21_02265 [Clostridiales bacterium]|nr:hypothetical protein [Clostridiales bacterium]
MTGLKNEMPLWGPYSKKYMGISRIIDSGMKSGARFDFSVHPTVWNSSVPVPNVTIPSNYHLWSCKSDYSFFSYRYELMWKDMIYCDVSFSEINEKAYLMRCRFVNNTDLKQNCILNMFSAMEYPKPFYCKADLPEKSLFINANDYAEYIYANPRPWDTENPDGMHKGEFSDYRFTGGFGLGDRCENYHVPALGLKPFGCEKGDRVAYNISFSGFSNPVVSIRYRTTSDLDAEFELNKSKVLLPASDELTVASFALEADDKIILESTGKGGVELDFLAVTERGDEKKIKTSLQKHGFEPKITSEKTKCGRKIKLEYPEAGEIFYVLTHNERTRERFLDSGCLEDALPNRLSNGDHTYDELRRTFSESFSEKKSDEGFFHNALIQSVFIDPHSEHTEYAVVSEIPFSPLENGEYEKIYENTCAQSDEIGFNSAGKKYSLSTDILKATLLTNVVYPVYKHGENIIHYTPGKRWDSFYTWDSGVIGAGILEFSAEKAKYILETYLSDEDNKDFAFLLHGSLVPTQFAQYYEMLKRAENKAPLFDLYDKMMRYYRFLAGADGSSTAKFQNGLLTTYDYWYSCSGMDDYPAQVYMADKQIMHKICPCISTSHIIRAAKIMRAAALAIGKSEDADMLGGDIEKFTNALNNLAWDEECGYYSYTVYDDDKNITGFLRNEQGENMNKGMDGVYPLVAGAVPEERAKRLLSHIKNPNEMWSKSGISAVDMSASYYFNDGYWNGNVWMAHQWFLWKAMFDLGEADFAFEIANRALEIWKNETDFSYNTYECFGIETQRGGWFHNFGGLSAPVCIWANAYYKPGTVTSGFDLWTDRQICTGESAEIDFKYYGAAKKFTVLACLSDKYEYEVYLNGEKTDFNEHVKGAVEISLSGSVKKGKIQINKK